MQSTTTVSKTALWTGRVMSALPVLLILLGSVMKLMKHPSVLEGFARAGVPERLILPVGLIELVCVVVYLIPRTSVLGAILMTGLLGGATITTLRVGDPTYPMPVFLGMLAWGGLYLRDVRLRVLIPLRQKSSGD
jgi:DoxX-like family